MPDGDAYSFYTTYNVLLDAAACRRLLLPAGASPERDCVAWPHYDDYVAYDVVRHVDASYRTRATREARGLGGLSMGGYGAIALALAYPGTFAAAASHSGVLAPLELAPGSIGRGAVPRPAADSAAYRRLRERWMPIVRVVFGADSAAWLARDPATLAARLAATGRPMPALYADAGTNDVYAAQNRAFRNAMQARGIPLTYREWPGGHTWDYWRAHVGESLAWLAARLAPPTRQPQDLRP
jgi:S-formylglutathione hydrolase FrmB